jgi:hypothetical protein
MYGAHWIEYTIANFCLSDEFFALDYLHCTNIVYTICMIQKLKPLLYLALFGVSLSLISLIIWLTQNKSNDNLYFGTIEHLENGTFEINDDFNGKLHIVISPTTELYKGTANIPSSDIKDGSFVQIVGPAQEQVVHAELIRIMDISLKK